MGCKDKRNSPKITVATFQSKGMRAKTSKHAKNGEHMGEKSTKSPLQQVKMLKEKQGKDSYTCNKIWCKISEIKLPIGIFFCCSSRKLDAYIASK